MADNLIFPIGFDLQKGVEEAGKDWDKYAQKLEAALTKRAVKVKFSIDTRNFDNLDAVKQRLAQLKIEPITPQTKSAIKELAAELKVLAKSLEQLQKYSVSKVSASPDEVRAARLAEIEQRRLKQLEQTRAAAARAEQAELRLTAARLKSANVAAKTTNSVNNLTKAYKTQSTYLDRLIKRLAVYASFSAVRTFLTSVRDVTAEFELQRVSLGAIIQDQQRANQLFGEIKAFALKSPLKILDLTKYVKQVAAYKIETDKLFDTTKRLADVSVGLGVDMGRLVLAYGQVKAASYLRAAEIRQFTEAGIPMLELLAEKFTEIQGKAVSTEQVMDLVSKRAVSFSMVEEIFKDMTDAGGMFYNMQEKQAQTLFGMWSKLGDAAAVMYEEIGNVGWVNAGMKEAIGLLESMMRNWENMAAALGVVSAQMLVYKIAVINANIANKAALTNAVAEAAFDKAKMVRTPKLIAGIIGQNNATKISIALSKLLYKARIREAMATNILSKAWYKLSVAVLSNPWTAALAVITAIAGYLLLAKNRAKELTKELNRISSEGATNAAIMVRNFEFLANKAVRAADGSKAQREALEELKRTYSDMIPTHLLTIKNLREMKENYELLTTAIREYAMQQAFSQQIEAVIANTTKKITDIQEKLKKKLKDSKETIITGVEGSGESQLVRSETISISFDDTQIRNALAGIAEYAKDTSLTVQEVIRKAFKDYAGVDLSDYEVKAIQELGGYQNNIVKLIATYREQESEIKKIIEQQKILTGEVGIYSDVIEQATKNISEWEDANKADKGTFKFDEGKAKKAAEEYLSVIRNIFQNSGLTFDEAWVDGKFIDILSISNALNSAGNQVSSQANKAFGKIARLYYNLVPSDEFSKTINNKFQEVAGNLKVNMDLIKKYLKTGDVDIDDYVKNFFDSIQELKKNIQQTKALLTSEALSEGDRATKSQELDNYKQELKVLKEMEPYIRLFYVDKSKGGDGGSDTRLQTLNEIERTLTSINNKYEELVKKEGQTAALDYVEKNYASTLEYVNKLGKKFGLKFEMPTEFKDLQTYRKNIQKVIETLKMKGYEKAAIELELKVAEGNQDKLEKQIDKQLKELADRISRTKTAKEFYQKILDITGNREVSMNITMGVYGADLAGRVRDKFMQAFSDIGEAMQKEFGSGNVDLLARPLIDAAELVKKGWEDAGDGIATVFSSQYGIEQAGKEVEILVTPILPDGTVLSQDELDDYVMNTLSGAKDILKADKKGIVISVGVSGDGEAGDRLHQLQEAYYDIKKLLADGDYLGLEKYLDMLPEKVRDNTKIMIENMRNGNKIDIGKALFEDTVEQIKEVFKTGSEEHPIDIDISAAIDITNQRINYKMLADTYEKYKNDIIEKNRDTAKNIVREGQKTAAENILTWEKELAKAKDFEQQRTDIINRETQRREAIIKSYEYTPEEKAQRISLSYDLQAKELSKLNVEEFKASDDYIRVFQDLDKVSSQTLKRLKTRLEGMIATAKEAENIEGVKALVEALNKIQTEQEKRGDPIKGMIDSFKKYRDARKELHEAEAAEAAAKSEFAEQEITLKADIATAKQEQAAAQQQVDKLKSQGLAGTSQMVTAELHLAAATTQVTKAEQKLGVAKQKVVKATEKTNKAQDKQREAEIDFKNKVEATAAALNNAASTIQNIADLFGIAEDSELGDIVNGLVSGLQGAATIMMTILGIAIAISSACWWLLAIGAAVAAFSALFSWISNSKVRKANKEIEKQQEILDQLEYSYGRLEKAAEKAFGGDYIKNFKAQQANLQAQIEATQKQLDAEQSKGKKTDDDKVKEYKEQIRDLKDELEDLQGTLSEHFLGTDLTSAARDFAQAWLDAYKEFGNTADAMSEKFQEMIENMVVEGAMAAVMERALKPMFDMIDEMEDGDFYSEDFWREVAAKAEQGAKDADAGAQTMMKFLEQAGISIRDLGGDLTGISRDIANASEESINGLAATMNTWSYYVSYVPQIAEHVAAMRAILESGGNPIQSGPGVIDLVTLQNQSLTHLQAINQHTAETVTECRRIAERCTAMAEDIHRVVVPKGTKGAYGIQTYIS